MEGAMAAAVHGVGPSLPSSHNHAHDPANHKETEQLVTAANGKPADAAMKAATAATDALIVWALVRRYSNAKVSFFNGSYAEE
jgi:hypothetical protein